VRPCLQLTVMFIIFIETIVGGLFPLFVRTLVGWSNSHPPYTPYSPLIHPLYTPYTPPMYPLYTPPMRPLYTPRRAPPRR